MSYPDLVINSVAVLLGEYSVNRKYAALILLKMLLPKSLIKALLNDSAVFPFNRGNSRVRAWTKDVISVGRCELCASTENLEAHHIIKWADYPQGRVDRRNGQCLCHTCHTEQHLFDRAYALMSARRKG